VTEVFKIPHSRPIYDETVSPHLPFYTRANTRGNNNKLVNHSFHHDLRKHFFSASTVNIWNSLPNSVVDASTINAFKARLTVKYDFTAVLTDTGNRPEEVTKW